MLLHDHISGLTARFTTLLAHSNKQCSMHQVLLAGSQCHLDLRAKKKKKAKINTEILTKIHHNIRKCCFCPRFWQVKQSSINHKSRHCAAETKDSYLEKPIRKVAVFWSLMNNAIRKRIWQRASYSASPTEKIVPKISFSPCESSTCNLHNKYSVHTCDGCQWRQKNPTLINIANVKITAADLSGCAHRSFWLGETRLSLGRMWPHSFTLWRVAQLLCK